jgi:hypothetical protein
MNRRSIFKFLFATPIVAALPRAAAAKPAQQLADLAIQVSRIVCRAHAYGDTVTLQAAQRMFWGMPGLEPGMASEVQRHIFYGAPYSRPFAYDEAHEHDPVKAGEFIKTLQEEMEKK